MSEWSVIALVRLPTKSTRSRAVGENVALPCPWDRAFRHAPDDAQCIPTMEGCMRLRALTGEHDTAVGQLDLALLAPAAMAERAARSMQPEAASERNTALREQACGEAW